jgi:hypothetical protein
MREDLLALLLLVGIGWGRLAVVVTLLRQRLPPLQSLFFQAFSHPYYRLVSLTTLLLAVGWASMLAQFGPQSLAAQLAGQPPPPSAQEIQRCHDYQLMAEDRGGPCPAGGELWVDAEGYLACKRHGRASGQHPVPVPSP